MSAQKPKAVARLEQQMESMDPSSFRYRVLDCAKNFKSSWISLGQHLFTVYQDKLYRDWGFLTFEAYCAKEVGVRQATAVKLLKSYSFLEKEEPRFVKREFLDDRQPDRIPGYEAVNALRLARQNEKITETEYKKLREDVFETSQEDAEVKKKIRYLLKGRAPAAAAAEEGPEGPMRRLYVHLQNSKKDLTDVPARVSKKIDELIDLLADFLELPSK